MILIKTKEEYEQNYKLSIENPEEFWDIIANYFRWNKPYDKVFTSDMPNGNASWFENGELNITENTLDRHVFDDPNKIALIWEPNNPTNLVKSFSRKQFLDEVCRIANGLKFLGLEKGDCVCIYMPMVPELIFAMQACARIGVVHSVVFAGFSAEALAMRVNDCNAKLVLTSTNIERGEKVISALEIVEEALNSCIYSVKALVLNLPLNKTKNDKLVNWNELISSQFTVCEPVSMNSEDPLFILYTSGSTGKPKGVVHTCGGYMVYTGYSFAQVFQPEYDSVFWCTADAGWITGHSYMCYGPMLNGTTIVMFEGLPTYPNPSRFWEIIEKHQVTHFYTAPTAIRSLMCFGDDIPASFSMNSLKLIGTVGEPINVEAFNWYNHFVGKNGCTIVDTWWQTETGGIMLSALGNVNSAPPSFAGKPLPGILPVLVDAQGLEIVNPNEEGLLCIKNSWPSIIRTTFGDHNRCVETYFSAFNNLYFTGDAAKRDENGFFRIIGRVDDVINVSGHRIGTAEVENAINEHINIVESAVVAVPHDIKGEAIYAFVIVLNEQDVLNLGQEVMKIVEKSIGKLARPDFIQVVKALPKTRSGKIMRRILRKIGSNDNSNFGDTSTLLDPTIIDQIWEKRIIKS